MERIVFAYSGGFESTAAITWLTDELHVEVVTVTLDLGQGMALDDVRERALAAGAVRAHVLDAKDEFAQSFVLPSLRAGALHRVDPQATALAQPVIAKHLVAIARIEGTPVVAHGAAPGSSGASRFDVLLRGLDPALRIIAPIPLMGKGPDEIVQFARERGIPVPLFGDRQYRSTRNLWGRRISGGLLDDPWIEAPEDIHALTRGSMDAPSAPAEVELSFENGMPRRINGVEMSFVELIQSLETIAGGHGVGRVDVVVRGVDGAPSRERHEVPAATVLHRAHRDLQRFVVPDDLGRITDTLASPYADLIAGGRWNSPTRAALDALVNEVQARVTGDVRVRLHKGDAQVVGRRSPFGSPDASVESDAALAEQER